MSSPLFVLCRSLEMKFAKVAKRMNQFLEAAARFSEVGCSLETQRGG